VPRRTLGFGLIVALTLAERSAMRGAEPPHPPLQRNSASTVAAPTHWVAVSADLEITSGPVTTGGKFYRNSSGSTRHEVVFPGRVPAITIRNRQTFMLYIRQPDGKWISAPFEPGKAGATPPAYRVSTPGLTRESVGREGFEIYKYANRDRTKLLAPALNFLPLEETTPDRREAMKNIKMGEPDPLLFHPPAGAEIIPYVSERELVLALSRAKSDKAAVKPCKQRKRSAFHRTGERGGRTPPPSRSAVVDVCRRCLQKSDILRAKHTRTSPKDTTAATTRASMSESGVSVVAASRGRSVAARAAASVRHANRHES
jgi:hypothetical protein